MNDVNTRPYHHGNLRAELIRIGVALVADSGLEALTVREMARRAGVSPAAVYRHFPGREGLRDAVREASQEALEKAIRHELDLVGSDAEEAELLLAAGRGYFTFATNEPELFACLSGGTFPPDAPHPRSAEHGSDAPPHPSPFTTLTELVTRTGVTPRLKKAQPPSTSSKDRAIVLWAAVHGIAVLCSNGTLRDLPEPRKHELLDLTLRSAIRGTTGIEPPE
ncbi:MAG: TetR/AcrR family transcriptional regulator [Propionibacteriaceae bacterium]|nr:TetR/AcrR family transcriptional regulator [Propionibacteriaceae bacterium]